jgi:hypothetical protein
MSYRSFWVRRFIQSGGYLPGAVPPLFDTAPFVGSSFIGKALELITGTILAGTPTPTITTEVVNLAGTVLPSSYVVQQGDQLRFKQTATNTAGTAEIYSGWVFAYPEITGYTTLSPVPRDTGVALTSTAQPGSRLHYISNTGQDPSVAQIYYWTGTQIVDSTGSTTGDGGVPYGTDWRNPTGPIKAFRHMSACYMTRNGLAPGIRTGNGSGGCGVGSLESSGTARFEKPDMWLHKRGDIFDTDADLADYKTFATGFTVTELWMGMPGGKDASNMQVMCDYGPTNLPRPEFRKPKNKGGAPNNAHPFISDAGKHIRYVGLYWNGRARDADAVAALCIGYWSNYTADKINQGFEDCRWDGMGFGDPTRAVGRDGGNNQVYFYRCTFTDCFATWLNTGHLSAMHSAADDPGTVQMIECIIARNGYKGVDPKRIEGGLETPTAYNASLAYAVNDIVLYNGEWYSCKVAAPVGTSITNVNYWSQNSTDSGRRALGTTYDRNLYLAGRSNMFRSIVLRGASQEQWRSGGFIKDNFIQTGGVYISDWFADFEDELQISLMSKNVIQNVQQSSVHTSTPIVFNMGVHFSLVEYNVCTGAAEPINGKGFMMASRPIILDTTTIYNRTRGNLIRKNLFTAGTGVVFDLYDGFFGGQTTDEAFAVWPSLTGNKILDNDVITTSSMTPTYTAGVHALPTQDTVATGNTKYTSASEYATNKGGVDSTRTLKKYLQSLGITVNSFDGVHEMVDIANTMDRFNWPAQYSAPAINNYIRTGLGFTVPA